MTAKQSGTYIDGFVLVVKKKDLTAYKRVAGRAGKIWMRHGALEYKECVSDDLNPDTGGYPMLPFQKLTKLKSNEVVIFSYISYRSRAHRDQVNAKVLADPAMNPDDPDHMENMPFDMKRLSFGGFKVIVDAS